MGIVKGVDVVRGFGLVECPDAGFNKDVHVNKKVAALEALSAGDVVAFSVQCSPTGVPQASAPIWKLAGSLPQGDSIQPGKFIGKVKNLAENGCGFVMCPEVTATHGRDAYIYHTVVQDCHLSEGELIAFNLHLNKQGMPQVSAPCWKCISSPDSFGSTGGEPAVVVPADLEGGASPMLGILQEARDNAAGKGAAPQVDPLLAGGIGVQGEPWNPPVWPTEPANGGVMDSITLAWGSEAGAAWVDGAKGLWGPQTAASWVPSCGKGAWQDGAKGCWQDGTNGCWPDGGKGGWQSWAAKGFGGKADGKACVKFNPGQSPLDFHDPSSFCIGKVRFVDATSGGSWVECAPEAGVSSVFVQDKLVTHPKSVAVGDVLAFLVANAQDGSPQAASPVYKMVGGQPQWPGPPGEFVGKVVSPMTANGNAFMECPEVKACFGKDAFIHSSVLLQCGLEGTEVIRFNLHINHAGMPQVSAPVWVRISDAWPTPSFAQSSQNVVGNASGGGFLGTVKEADPSKGYSVITATDQSNPQDVFLLGSISEPGNFAVSDYVAFTSFMGKTGIEAAAPVWKLVGQTAPAAAPQLGDFVGTVKAPCAAGTGSFVDCRGVSDSYGHDAFAHISVISQCGLVEGDVIAFKLDVSNQGVPQVSSPCWKCVSDKSFMLAVAAAPRRETLMHAVPYGQEGPPSALALALTPLSEIEAAAAASDEPAVKRLRGTVATVENGCATDEQP